MRRGKQGRLRGLLTVVAIVCVALGANATKAETENALAYEGVISEGERKPLFVDSVHRKLYTSKGTLGDIELAEFDLDAPYGSKPIRVVHPPLAGRSFSEPFIATDPVRRRVFIVDQSYTSTTGNCPDCSFIRVLDLRTLEFTQTWDFTKIIPNFGILGVTYSHEDGRLYIAGVHLPLVAITAGIDLLQFPYYPVSIVALDVTTGTLAWSRTLTKCLRLISTLGITRFFRGSGGLYFGCARPDTTFSVAPYPGAAGVDRLVITPKANQADALLFREEFFRVPGAFFSLVGAISTSAFDYATERMVFTSASIATPGVWIFDGRLSSWVGFVPTDGSKNNAMSVDPMTGHLFVYSETGGITVIDLRATPVPQGVTADLSTPQERLVATTDPYLIDPPTRRVFIYSSKGGAAGADHVLAAFRDRTPVVQPDTPVEYDDLTQGIAEGPGTSTTFSATAKGFGARAMLVGGTNGLTSPGRNGLAGGILASLGTGAIVPADRGLWAARVSTIDLRNVAATADAQAAVPDDATGNQRRFAQHDAAQNGVPDAVVSTLDWPLPPAFCLDAGEQAATETHPHPSGQAAASCDLEAQSASASARAGALQVGDVSIGSARFTGASVRRAGEGIQVDAEATVHGVEVKAPGAGTLRIADVRQHVIAEAGGRPGTARVIWEPSIEGVEILDASGRRLFACAKSCDLKKVASLVNDVFSQVMRMRVPDSERVATPGGAFAGFSETHPDFVNDLVMNNDASRAVPAIHLEIYNDWQDKSRLVLQLAAIESSAIYGISSSSQESAPDPGEPPAPASGPALEPSQPGIVEPPSFPSAPVAPAPPLSVAPPAPIIQRLVRSALFAARSPKDAISMVLILSLFAGIAGLGMRRGSLIKLLSKQHVT